MNVLFVFDADIDFPALNGLGAGLNDKVHLFSLTSKKAVSDAVLELCREAGCSIEVIDTATGINRSSDNIRDRYLKFIAALPARVCDNGKDLKEIFAIDGNLSAWWLGLIAEKNMFKSDTFFRLVQMDLIVNTVKTAKIDKIICGFDSKRLHKALFGYSSANGIKYQRISNLSGRGWKDRFKSAGKMLYIKHLAILGHFAAEFFLRTVRIKLKFFALRRTKHIRPLMVATYYPNIDIPSAKRGVFKSKFWPDFQESLESADIDVTWIAIYVPNSSISFNDSMNYAANFIKNGYSLYFIEEFNSIPKQAKVFWMTVVNGFKFLKMEKEIRAAHAMDDYNFYELFRDDWYSSFVGSTGYVGILYYMIFSSVFKEIDPAKCIYQCEMHAWEKALLSAGKAVGHGSRLYAYQPATLSRMLLNCFNDPAEVRSYAAYSMPRPDKIICNGDLPCRYMEESGWPKEDLMVGEAIRYSYLKEHMKKTYAKKNIVLLALSTSPKENSSILRLAAEGLRDLRDIEVWIKPHPFLDDGGNLEKAGLVEDLPHFKVRKEPIGNLLPDVRIVIGGETGVAIEALAFGCEFITIRSSEWIDMSPLRYERSGIINRVSSADELKEIVKKTAYGRYEAGVVKQESLKILNDFFYLDPASDTPSRILELLGKNEEMV